MNIVNMWVMTMITISILDEVLLWMRCRQLRREAREAMNRLIEVLETPNNEHLYSTILWIIVNKKHKRKLCLVFSSAKQSPGPIGINTKRLLRPYSVRIQAQSVSTLVYTPRTRHPGRRRSWRPSWSPGGHLGAMAAILK